MTSLNPQDFEYEEVISVIYYFFLSHVIIFFVFIP